ncbi:VOC family protein [Pseudoxanthomonas wuyuanensis]
MKRHRHDHVELAVEDVGRSGPFYAAALAPLGLEPLIEVPAERTRTGTRRLGFGRDGCPLLWIHGNQPLGHGTHLAIAARSRRQVDEFHRAALAAGGRDNGAPGVRHHYHGRYYAAYVFDPGGVNLEAAFQGAP